jgi:ribosomal protein L14E/L6E/L27E
MAMMDQNNRNLVFTTLLFVIVFLSACGEEDIPKEDNVKKVDWNHIVRSSKTIHSQKIIKEEKEIDNNNIDEEEIEIDEDDSLEKEQSDSNDDDEVKKEEYQEYSKKLTEEMNNYTNYNSLVKMPPPIPAFESNSHNMVINHNKTDGEVPPTPPMIQLSK